MRQGGSMMKKKLITLLLAVSLMVTLTPAMSFADESDIQQDAGQVVQMESQEETGEEALMQAQEDADQAVAGPEEEAPEEEIVPGDEVSADGDVAQGNLEAQDLEAATSIEWTKEGTEWVCLIDGQKLTGGMRQVGAAWYFFTNEGYMRTGLQSYSAALYYFNPNGTDPSRSDYGARVTGLQNVPGYGFLYFDPTTGMQRTGWIQIPNIGTCYFDQANRGVMATGMKTIGNSTYFFASNGAMQFNRFQKIGTSTYYFGSNGVMRTGWLTLGNNKYYLGSNGAMRTGWQTISGDKYYFNTSNGVMTKGGPVNISGSKYYFNSSNGKMVKGWQTISGSRYFFNTSNGKMQTGWLTYKGKKYYLQSSGKAKIGLSTIKGNRYYFQSDASMMRNSAVKVKGKLYYFLKNGKGYKKKGWFKGSDGGKRYSLGKGRVQTGKKKIKGIWYQFNKYTGISKTLGDSFDMSIQSVTSQTKYLITINRAKYEVRVYQGKKNNWTRIKKMSCGIGAPATPTPAGTFVTTSRMQVNAYTLNGTKVRYWYHTQFQSDGNKGIHSGLYYVATGEPYDTALKTNNSQGSVRVDLNNAEWIYYNVPLYTTVYIK